MTNVTQILSQIEQGDPSAAEQLLPVVYDELRALAARRMAQESPEHTLQATALVHEVYIRLVSGERAQKWKSRGHFFGAAAEAMRRILVEKARQKRSRKGGAGYQQVDLDENCSIQQPPLEDLFALDEALERLEREDPTKAQLVKLRYFAGLSEQEAATALGISRATASRYWSYAKVWLYCAVRGKEKNGTEAKKL